jgi:hypothetical protein
LTYYDILGVPRDAQTEQIRAAYRELAKKHHPDLLQNASSDVQAVAEERLKAINEAYTALSDPKKRRDYHLLMWTSQDPARRYRHLFPSSTPPPQPSASRRGRDSPDQEIATVILRLQSLKWDRRHLSQRQELKRRRFWLSIGFSSLIVFTIMWFEYLTLSATTYNATTQFAVYLITFFSCELIAVPIVINTSGMRLPKNPLLGNPIVFSISVFAGTTMACLSLLAPRALGTPSPTSIWAGGFILSLSMLTHLFVATQLGRLQEQIFRIEKHQLFQQVRDLEQQLSRLRKQRKGG